MYPTAKQLEFPEWQTDGMQITVYDPKKRCSIGIAFDSFSFTQDSRYVEQERDYVLQAARLIPSGLKVDRFLRLGLRRWYLTAVDIEFENLASILNVKFFSNDDRLLRVLPEKFEDLTYVSINSENSHTARITVGPMRKKEIPGYIQVDKEHHLERQHAAEKYLELVKNYPEIALYMDIDYFRSFEEPTQVDVEAFYGTAAKRISEMAMGINEYVFSTRLEA